MKKKAQEEDKELAQFQVDFITKKVTELGGYKEVVGFYTNKDLVSSFAHKLARKVYNVKSDEDDEEEIEEVKVPAKKAKKSEAKTVKRKRKIDVKNLEE